MIPASKNRSMKKDSNHETKSTTQNSKFQSRLMLSQDRFSQTPGTKIGGHNKISLVKNTTLSSTDRLSSSAMGLSNVLYSSSRHNFMRKSQQYPQTMQSTIINDTGSLKTADGPSTAVASPNRQLFNTTSKAPSGSNSMIAANQTPVGKKHMLKQLLQPISARSSTSKKSQVAIQPQNSSSSALHPGLGVQTSNMRTTVSSAQKLSARSASGAN